MRRFSEPYAREIEGKGDHIGVIFLFRGGAHGRKDMYEQPIFSDLRRCCDIERVLHEHIVARTDLYAV